MKWLANFAVVNWQNALAGAVGALAVVITWAIFSALAHWPSSLIWIERHPGLAAWVQAFFSVVAIGASSFFAFWVPIHLRDVGERDAVQRAINTILILINTTYSAWESTRQILDNKEWNTHSTAFINELINSSSAMINLIPVSMQLGGALLAVDHCRSRLVVLREFSSRLNEVNDVYDLAKDMPFDDILADLEELAKNFGAMKPLKIAGSWMIFAQEDGVYHSIDNRTDNSKSD